MQSEKIERLVELAEKLGLEPDDLSEVVYDNCHDDQFGSLLVSDADDRASRARVMSENINSNGLEAQLEYLLSVESYKRIRALLLEISKKG